MKGHNRRPLRRVDLQVFLFTAALVIAACSIHFLVGYHVTYKNTIDSLTERVQAIYGYVEHRLDTGSFDGLRSRDDMSSQLYADNQTLLAQAREAAGVRYLYTATRTADGKFIYLLDGLPLDAEDFRVPGDDIEVEIIPELERAMAGEEVMPREIKPTEWGKIFIAYLPVHRADEIVGVVGVEFDAESQYNTYFALRVAAPLVILCACIAAAALAVVFFRRISNPRHKDLYNTDQLTQLKSSNAFSVDFGNWNQRRSKLSVGVILVDLNYLKKVNDQLGHPVGDAYLRLAAQILLELRPPNAEAYRVGGDELTIVVWDAVETEVAALADRLETRFQERKPDWPVNTSLAVGHAVYDPERDEDLYDTFKRADERLYKVKARQHRDAESREGR